MHWHLLNNSFCGVIFFALLNPFCFAQQYVADTGKSSIEFTVTHLGVLSVTGSFSEFKTEIGINKNSIKAKSVIEASSISTENGERDKIIKGDGYLDVKNYPQINFSGTGIKTKKSFSIKGVLTLHGKSKEQKLTCETANGEKIISCSTILKRGDFDLDFGAMNALISNEVQIHLIMQLIQIK
jgi:polyisoprenoid-binding protein YceI